MASKPLSARLAKRRRLIQNRQPKYPSKPKPPRLPRQPRPSCHNQPLRLRKLIKPMDHQSSDSTNLKVIARAPFQLYYEGEAKLVSGENRVGKFDILPGHA